MNKLTLSLPLSAVLAMLMSCGPSSTAIKNARETHYRAEPATLYAAVKATTESTYKTAASDENSFVLRSEANWYTPEGQIDRAQGTNIARLQQDSINFSVVVSVVKVDADTYKVNVEPVALRLHGLVSKPERVDMSDPSVPGWVHGKVESLELGIYERLKQYAVTGSTVPAMVPPAAGSAATEPAPPSTGSAAPDPTPAPPPPAP